MDPAAITTSPHRVRLVVGLAWPVVAAMGLHGLFSIVDLFWVGKLNAAAVAAVSTGVFLSWALISLGEVFCVGVLALVSRAVGAGNRDEAARVSWQGMTWVLLASVVVGAGLWFTADVIYRGISLDPLVRALGADYLRMLALITPAWFANLMFQEVFRAVGDMRTPFRILLVAVVVNFFVDPLLIMGWGPVPAMGVEGAALATGLAQLLGVVLYLVATDRGTRPLPFRDAVHGLRPRLPEAARMIRIGLPMTSIGIMFSVVYLVLARVAGEFGVAAVAALGIVNRIESVSFLTGHGLGLAASTLVGQNLGAGKPDRAEACAAIASRLAMGVGAAAMVAFLLVPEALVRLFTDDPATVAEGALALRILAWCQVLQAWELVLEGSFAGSGHTLPAMLISVPMSLVRIPAAWFLAVHLGLGSAGLWWTITVTAALRGVLLRWWWGRGTWRTVGESPQPETGPVPLP